MEENILTNIREYHTKNRVHFIIDVAENRWNNNVSFWEKLLKINSSISIKNMVAFT